MPVLAWVVRAARAATLVDSIVVATTTSPQDDQTANLCRELGVDVVRGPIEDVLSRFLKVLDGKPADLVVRLTADCPLLDPRLIDAAVSLAQGPAAPDYVSTTLVRTLPRGLDVEVIRSDALRSIGREAAGYHRVHVTSLAYSNPARFSCLGISTSLEASDLRLTVDTPADLALVRAVVGVLGPGVPESSSLVRLLRSRPDLVKVNSHVRQKALREG